MCGEGVPGDHRSIARVEKGSVPGCMTRSLDPAMLLVGHGPATREPAAAMDQAIARAGGAPAQYRAVRASTDRIMRRLQKLNLTLRVLLEVGVVAALAYWGVHARQSASAKVLLGIGAPLVGLGFWGTVDFHRSRHGEMLRLVQELVISGLAAAACYTAGRTRSRSRSRRCRSCTTRSCTPRAHAC